MRNDYKVICEKKYSVVFTDGQEKEQKIEISKEVEQVIWGEQTRENKTESRMLHNNAHLAGMPCSEYLRTLTSQLIRRTVSAP